MSDVTADLNEFIQDVRRINPALRIVLTVSPMPLVATATGGHVLPATIYSKSVLRVAAEEVVRANSNILYFPAYEIVTGPQAPEAFYEKDRRNVSTDAVETVMAALLARCERVDADGATASATVAPARPPATAPAPGNVQTLSRLIAEAECDEAMSDASLQQPA